MNFFKLYVGDYMRDTGTLTLAQHGAYVQMLMQHYATEQPLPTGRELHRLLRADGKADRDAIDYVAAKFWTVTDAGLVNERAAKEFARAAVISDTNREIAVRREATKRARTEHEPSTKRAQSVAPQEHHQTPDTRLNTEPPAPAVPPPLAAEPKKRAIAPKPEPTPIDVDAQVWTDWQALRAKKRAPVTQTVIEEARKEAAKAGMSFEAFLRVWCSRGSQGLQADWLKPNERGQPAALSFRERDQQAAADRMAQIAPGVAARPRHQQPTAEVFDVTARLLG